MAFSTIAHKLRYAGPFFQMMVSCCIVGLMVCVALGLGMFDGLERRAFDQRIKLFRSKSQLPGNIALVMIDEASLEAILKKVTTCM